MPPETDGVVILNTAFGTTGSARAPFDMGRTAVHEVGHWIDLRHIWGDSNNCSGSDFVDDTPNAQMPNFGKPTFPHVSCSNDPNGDMFMNYMDYVDDDTMIMFTPGFELRPDQSLVEIGIGPTDRVEESPGKWKLERGNQLLFYSQSSPEPTRTMQIASVDDDHLVIKK